MPQATRSFCTWHGNSSSKTWRLKRSADLKSLGKYETAKNTIDDRTAHNALYTSPDRISERGSCLHPTKTQMKVRQYTRKREEARCAANAKRSYLSGCRRKDALGEHGRCQHGASLKGGARARIAKNAFSRSTCTAPEVFSRGGSTCGLQCVRGGLVGWSCHRVFILVDSFSVWDADERYYERRNDAGTKPLSRVRDTEGQSAGFLISRFDADGCLHIRLHENVCHGWNFVA